MSKKKLKKGKAQTLALKSDDLLENDDDGSISKELCAHLCRLMQMTSKSFHKTAVEFLEICKNKCALSVGMALIAFYDGFPLPEDLPSKLICIYLIYKVRDIEVPLRRKTVSNSNEIFGHPFIEFFLSIIGSKVVEPLPFDLPQPSLLEQQFVRRILGRRVSELSSRIPIDIVYEDGDDGNFLDKDNIFASFAAQIARWPKLFDGMQIMGLLSDAEGSPYPRTSDMLIDEMASILCTNSPPTFPPQICTILPKMHPISDIEIPEGMLDLVRLEREEAHKCDPVKVTISHSLSNAIQATGRYVIGNSDTEGTQKPPPSQSAQASSKSETTASNKSSYSRSPVASKNQMEAFTKKLIEGTLLSQSELRLVVHYVASAPPDDSFLIQLQLIPDLNMPKFIEENVKVASEVIYKAVLYDEKNLNRYMNILLNMELSVQCMEVIQKLYRNITGLAKEPLNEYVRYCITSCKSPHLSVFQLSRLIRLVCILIQTLIKENIINLKDCSTELLQFVMDLNQYRETTSLYQTILAAMNKGDSNE